MNREDLIKAKEALEAVMKSFQPTEVIGHYTNLEPIACFRSVFDWLDEEIVKTESKFYADGNYIYFGDGSDDKNLWGIRVFDSLTCFPPECRGSAGANLIAELLNKHRAKGGI